MIGLLEMQQRLFQMSSDSTAMMSPPRSSSSSSGSSIGSTSPNPYCSSPPSSPPNLAFSIENILKPNFGKATNTFKEEPLSIKTPPPSPKPVDLSKESTNEDDESKDDCPPGMVRGPNGQLWPAWVFCTRYSDRPSSGPRSRKVKKVDKIPKTTSTTISPASATMIPVDLMGVGTDKRARTAFTSEQLAHLKREFEENRYLTEERRKNLSQELGLNESQIKIWFQNKRAKLKKTSGQKGELAQMLAAQGLYNHSTVPHDEEY